MLRKMHDRSYLKPIIIVVLLSFVWASAETITLRDGSKLTGTITKQTETQLELKTSYGTLTIEKSNVVSVDYGSQAIQPQSQPQQTETQPSISQGDYSAGYNSGKSKGYDDGYSKGAAEQKSQRLSGSLVGWLCWVVVLGVIVLASASSAY